MQESTIGAAFLTQTLAVNDITVKFEIWDTAGQERYHSLAPMYYRGAAAAVIVYDITNAVCTLLVSSTDCMFIIFNEKSRVPFCVRHSLYPFSSLLRRAPSGTRSCCGMGMLKLRKLDLEYLISKTTLPHFCEKPSVHKLYMCPVLTLWT